MLLDILYRDERWASWSADALERAAGTGPLVINPIIFAEISVGFTRIEGLENALPDNYFVRTPLPWSAAFLAGRCLVQYKRRGAQRSESRCGSARRPGCLGSASWVEHPTFT